MRAAILAGRTQLLDLLACLSMDRMDEPGVIADWSVKDLLAHILVHEQSMQAWVEAVLCGEAPQGPQPLAMPDEQLDLRNAEIWLENRDRLLEDILVDLELAHQRSLGLLDFPGSELLFDPASFHLRDGEALWEAVAANTYEHVAEHGLDINAWLVS